MEPFAGARVELNLHTGEYDMLRKIVTFAVVGASLAIAGCNTVRGAAQDVNSVANEVDSAT